MANIAITRKTYAFTYVILLILTGATTAFAYIDLGVFNTVVAVAIAGAKAMLIALVFMHLLRSEPLVRLTAIGGLVWIFFMFVLVARDYATRGWLPVPGR